MAPEFATDLFGIISGPEGKQKYESKAEFGLKGSGLSKEDASAKAKELRDATLGAIEKTKEELAEKKKELSQRLSLGFSTSEVSEAIKTLEASLAEQEARYEARIKPILQEYEDANMSKAFNTHPVRVNTQALLVARAKHLQKKDRPFLDYTNCKCLSGDPFAILDSFNPPGWHSFMQHIANNQLNASFELYKYYYDGSPIETFSFAGINKLDSTDVNVFKILEPEVSVEMRGGMKEVNYPNTILVSINFTVPSFEHLLMGKKVPGLNDHNPLLYQQFEGQRGNDPKRAPLIELISYPANIVSGGKTGMPNSVMKSQITKLVLRFDENEKMKPTNEKFADILSIPFVLNLLLLKSEITVDDNAFINVKAEYKAWIDGNLDDAKYDIFGPLPGLVVEDTKDALKIWFHEYRNGVKVGDGRGFVFNLRNEQLNVQGVSQYSDAGARKRLVLERLKARYMSMNPQADEVMMSKVDGMLKTKNTYPEVNQKELNEEDKKQIEVINQEIERQFDILVSQRQYFLMNNLFAAGRIRYKYYPGVFVYGAANMPFSAIATLPDLEIQGSDNAARQETLLGRVREMTTVGTGKVDETSLNVWNVDGSVLIPYFYFGSLLDIILPKVLQDEKDDFTILFGDLLADDGVNGFLGYSIANIPISLAFFAEWWHSHVSEPKRVSYRFKEFVTDIINDLAMPSLTNTMKLANRKVMNTKLGFAKITGAKNNFAQIEQISSPETRKKIAAIKTSERADTKPHTYVFLYCIETANLYKGAGDEAKDAENGIYHFRPQGFINQMSFTRESNAARTTALAEQTTGMGVLGQHMDKYNCNVKMIGFNNLVQPGSTIFVNPSRPSALSPDGTASTYASIARLNMGGYYMVDTIRFRISKALMFETEYECKWVAPPATVGTNAVLAPLTEYLLQVIRADADNKEVATANKYNDASARKLPSYRNGISGKRVSAGDGGNNDTLEQRNKSEKQALPYTGTYRKSIEKAKQIK